MAESYPGPSTDISAKLAEETLPLYEFQYQAGYVIMIFHSPTRQQLQKPHLSPEDDYHFVKKPSEDMFCPVTMGVLLQPHLTSCCGKHISEESATRIQGEGGPCPLCKSQEWSSVLNKLFRHEVNELHVFCHHKQQGCWWKGQLSEFENHVQSCSFRYSMPSIAHGSL